MQSQKVYKEAVLPRDKYTQTLRRTTPIYIYVSGFQSKRDVGVHKKISNGQRQGEAKYHVPEGNHGSTPLVDIRRILYPEVHS